MLERARRYLAQMPPAIAGSGGHVAAFRAAAVLVRGFELSVDDAVSLLREDYNPHCEPPWSDAELRHKAEDAAKADKIPLGYLLNGKNKGGARHGGSKKAASPAVYKVQDGCLFRNSEKLTNFTARIEEELAAVGAESVSRTYRVSGALANGDALPTVSVPASEFASMEWIADGWGARTIIEPGRSAADKVRAAIQTLSSPTTRTIHTGHGWREIDGKQVYLLPGPHLPPQVEIEHGASAYSLAGEGSPTDAYRAAIDLLDVAPLGVTVPLVGAAFVALFCSMLELDFGIWISGLSGKRKSSLAALVLCFFGRFTMSNLPLNFLLDTATYIEARLHQLKDLLTVLDNCVPPQTRRDAEEQTSKGVRVIQAVGDHSSRGRCGRDASVKPRRNPQGLAICTGERMPAENESTLGRVIFITLGDGTVDLARLSDLQARAALLPVAMRHLVEVASPRLDGIVAELRARRDALAVEFRERLVSAHGRTPGALASVMAGYELMLRLATEVGAASSEQAARLRALGFDALVALGLGQPKPQAVGPAEFYLQTIRAMIAQGTRVLVAEHEALNCTKTVGEHDVEVKNAVGWRLADQVWLMPALAWQGVVEFYRGVAIPYTQLDVHRGLAEQGLLIDRDEEGRGRFTARRSPAGKRERVLVLARHAIEEIDPEAASGPPAADDVDYLHLLEAV